MAKRLSVPKRKRPPSVRTPENVRLEVKIQAAHERTRETYGPERLQADLADNGIEVGIPPRVRQFASENTYFSLRHPSVYAGFRPHFWKCV